MKNFYEKHKKAILIALCVCVAAVLAVAAVFALTDAAKRAFDGRNYLSSNPNMSQTSFDIPAQASAESALPEPVAPLVVTSPNKNDVTVSESHYAITGTSDPSKPLVMNGKEISRLESGEFSVDVELAPGKNTFVFEYNDQRLTYIIRYDFVIVKGYAPFEKQTYEAGSSFVAVVYARVDSSSVTATFSGQTVNLVAQPYNDGEEFTNFTGTFTLPSGNENDLNMGGVKFKATCRGVSKSYASPSIICLRDKALDGSQVVEIVSSQAETFNGDTTDDWSRPTNSYLPQGTVDYKVGGIVYEAESGNSYYNLRCGKRVYVTKKNAPDPERVTVSKAYSGELPEYNTVSLESGGSSEKHTVFEFNVGWRAPFAVELAPQSYTNPAKQDYSISAVTYSYVDIKFFYAQTIDGNFGDISNPLFLSAQIIPVADGCILRLHLRQTGAFYGWNAEYNAAGRLEFKFLNPPSVLQRDDLTGLKIVIDAGHGGRDIGASGIRPDAMPEAERNLNLAYKLKAELESRGATVIMTRSDNVSMSADARCEFLRRQMPDLCISLHHDSSTRASASGGSVFCFNAFSDRATKSIFERTAAGGFYGTVQKGWHYFYLARVTACPVVLTENGFISNLQDFAGISDEGVNIAKAKAITQGVLDYFNTFAK